jgi:hypothetical protein
MRNKHINRIACIFCMVIGILVFNMKEIYAQMKCNKCDYWQSQVDSKMSFESNKQNGKTDLKILIKSRDLKSNSAFINLNQDEIFFGIKCFLELKGKKYESKLNGTTRPDVSQRFGATSVEVAALYYISYIFYQKWDHADAPFLINSDKKFNTDESVSAAYGSYEKWFTHLNRIGLEEARKQKLDPLASSGVSWY